MRVDFNRYSFLRYRNERTDILQGALTEVSFNYCAPRF